VPPPNWEQERRARDVEPEPTPQVSAHEAMMLAALERGEIDEPPPLGPPARDFVPLVPVPIPEADWREEERLRDRWSA
jgi:hypothetical protein